MRKLISVDIETSGLDAEKCVILSIGAVVINLDTKEKEHTFYGVINHESFHGEPYALMMNAELIEKIAKGNVEEVSGNGNLYLKADPISVPSAFLRWLEPHKEYSVVGKNFANFDLKFFEKAYGHSPFNRRILDVGSMFYDVIKDDKIPNLSECLSRASMNNIVTHNALEDAQQVADLILWKAKGLDKYITVVDPYIELNIEQ